MTAQIIPFPGIHLKLRDLAAEFIKLIDANNTSEAGRLVTSANLNEREKQIFRGYINEFRGRK